jgi:hypothetical protein
MGGRLESESFFEEQVGLFCQMDGIAGMISKGIVVHDIGALNGDECI